MNGKPRWKGGSKIISYGAFDYLRAHEDLTIDQVQTLCILLNMWGIVPMFSTMESLEPAKSI